MQWRKKQDKAERGRDRFEDAVSYKVPSRGFVDKGAFEQLLPGVQEPRATDRNCLPLSPP